MYATIHTHPKLVSQTIFRLKAKEIDGHLYASAEGVDHDFEVDNDFDVEKAYQQISKSLNGLEKGQPISVDIGCRNVKIDAVLADQLIDCFFSFQIANNFGFN